MAELEPIMRCEACGDLLPFDDRQFRFKGNCTVGYHRRCLPPPDRSVIDRNERLVGLLKHLEWSHSAAGSITPGLRSEAGS